MASRQMNMDKGEKQIYGAGDGNRTNPNEPNKGVTTRSTVQLESNGVKSSCSVNEHRFQCDSNVRITGEVEASTHMDG